MLSITTGYKRVFILVTVWVHPHQACYRTLAEVAHKLVLLMDGSADWVYTFIQLNKALSHAPLSSMGHISTIKDGEPSTDACNQLHQLQVCKLLQYKDLVVCRKASMARWKAHSSPSKSFPSGMPLPLVNLPVNCS